MENISHSLPKRSFSSTSASAFTPQKSVYDDVFGRRPPKLGLPNLAPRLDDYSEIFGGFHASRFSSIPVIDLQLSVLDSDLHFDVRSSSFDYTEVFGDIGGLDFAASLEDLIGQSSGGGYDSSDEPWSPAHSGSFSDELDPLAGSDKSQILLDGDIQQPLETIKYFNASYNMSSEKSIETVLAPASNAVPRFTFSNYESSVSWDGEDDHSSMGVVDDINHSTELGGKVRKQNQYKCSKSLPSGFEEKHGNFTTPHDKPFVTVSDISLRTVPSRLPPPVRPPPVLFAEKGECERSSAELEASESYDFKSVRDDSALLFFDVEIDASTSSEGRPNEKNVEVKNQSTKETIERKYTQVHSCVPVEEKTDKISEVSSSSVDDKLLQSHGIAVSVPVIDERMDNIKSSEGTSGSPSMQCCSSSSENFSEAVAWRKETEYFEVIENNSSGKVFDIFEDCDTLIQDVKQDAYIHQENVVYDSCTQTEDCDESKVTKELHIWDEESCDPQMNLEHYGYHNEQQMDILSSWPSDKKRSPEKLKLNKLDCAYDQNKKMPNNFFQRGGREAFEVKLDAKGNADEAESTGSPKRMHIEKKYVEPQVMKQKSGKHSEKTELHGRQENVEGAETTREIVKVRTEAEGTMKEDTGVSGKQTVNEAFELKDNDDVVLKESKKNRESDKKSYVVAEHDKSAEGKDKEQTLIYEQNVINQRNGVASKSDDNFLRFQMSSAEAGNKKETFGESDLKIDSKSSLYETGTRMDDTLDKPRFSESSKNKDELNHKSIYHATKTTPKSPSIPKQVLDSDISGSGTGISYVIPEKMSSDDARKMNVAELASKRIGIRDNISPSLVIRDSVASTKKVQDDSSFLRVNDDTLFPLKSATNQWIERNNMHMKENLAAKDQRIGERVRKETAVENEQMRKLEEEWEREREREKDRMAVDKAALDAREKRSYSEERSAVERVNAAIRQRVVADGRASMEARLWAERAAVERATSEARQRATEKLMSHKSAFDPHDQVQRSVPDRFSATYKFADTRHVPSDFHSRSTGISSDRIVTFGGGESESPQRCKARIERCRRTSERAANALAEKNQRDLLAQREREERNRVGEALDAEVKRWLSGKEGNLRALLSTLQYILGPESGWHPVPLTEVITSAAVKKAYRKATLCVHPDKLQQRGATIQQKYISEKVFDLLKEAWNKFNSEER